jgi:nucleotide-binding universal stress UspA family protein
MSIFPTRVLLATDGSEEASSATEAAVEISQKTDSELHVVHVYGVAPIYPLYPEATDPGGVELEDPVLEEELEGLSE